MRTLLLATVVILAMRTLVLATASSMVMATAGTVFAERASTTFQKLALAAQIVPRHAIAQAEDSSNAAQLAVALALRSHGAPGNVRLAQGRHPSSDSRRTNAA